MSTVMSLLSLSLLSTASTTVRTSSALLWLPSSARPLHASAPRCAKRWRQKKAVAFQSELRNPVAEVYGGSEDNPTQVRE